MARPDDDRDRILRNLSRPFSGQAQLTGGNQAEKLLTSMGSSGINIAPAADAGNIYGKGNKVTEFSKARQDPRTLLTEEIITDYIKGPDGNLISREALEEKHELSDDSRRLFNANLAPEQLNERGLVAIRNSRGEIVNINEDNMVPITNTHGETIGYRIGFEDTRTWYTKANKRELINDQMRRDAERTGANPAYVEAAISSSTDMEDYLGGTSNIREAYRRNFQVDTLYSDKLMSLGDMRQNMTSYLAGANAAGKQVEILASKIKAYDTSYEVSKDMSTGPFTKLKGGATGGDEVETGSKLLYGDFKERDLSIDSKFLGTDTFKLKDRFYVGKNLGDLSDEFENSLKESQVIRKVIVSDDNREYFESKLNYVLNKEGKEFLGTNLSNGNVLAMYINNPIGPDLTDPVNQKRVLQLYQNTNMLGISGREFSMMKKDEKEQLMTYITAHYKTHLQKAITDRFDAAVATGGAQVKGLITNAWSARKEAGALYASLKNKMADIKSNLDKSISGRELLEQSRKLDLFTVMDNGEQFAPNLNFKNIVDRLATMEFHSDQQQYLKEIHEQGYITDQALGLFHQVINYQHVQSAGLEPVLAKLETVLDIAPGGLAKRAHSSPDRPGDRSKMPFSGPVLEETFIAAQVQWDGKNFVTRTRDDLGMGGRLPVVQAELIDKLHGIYETKRRDYDATNLDEEMYIQSIILNRSAQELKDAYPNRLNNLSIEDIERAQQDMKSWSRQDFRSQIFELVRLKQRPTIAPKGTDIISKSIAEEQDKITLERGYRGFPSNILARSDAADQYEAKYGTSYGDRPVDPYTNKQFEMSMDYDYVGAKEAGMKPDADGKMGSIGLDGLILKMPEHPTYDETIKAEKKRGNIIIRIGNREYSVPPDYVQGKDKDEDEDKRKK
jgi:hypothetical protein